MKKPFIPKDLPPKLDNFYTPEVVNALGKANRALAKLGELPHLLPNTDLLAAPLLRKEAVLSSKIEGTQTTLSELFKYEAQVDGPANHSDAKEVENYVKSMRLGMGEISKLALTSRVLKNMHKMLLTGVRNEQGIPGEFRDFQNYIGRRGTPIEQATYVPPPPQEVNSLMGNLEKYMNDKGAIEDPIVQAALIHYQFEAIHPFGDGNGRIGRLLIPLFFFERNLIRYPLVYVSEFFDTHIEDYYARLREVSETGDWVNWIRFFIHGITEQSEKTYHRGASIIDLYKKTHEKVRKEEQSANAVSLVEHIFKHPYTAAPFLARHLSVSHQTAMRLLERFVTLGILKTERGVMRRQKFSRPVRLYVFRELIDIVNAPFSSTK